MSEANDESSAEGATSNDVLDARYAGCTTGAEIKGRIQWLKMQEAHDIDVARQRYESFWILEIMKKYPNMPYQVAAREFFTNGARCI